MLSDSDDVLRIECGRVGQDLEIVPGPDEHSRPGILDHWAQRQAEKAGIGFTPMDNAFADVDDVPALQAICDSLGAQHPQALLNK